MKKRFLAGPRDRRGCFRRFGVWAALGWVLGITACAGPGTPPIPVDQYIFEYETPRTEGGDPLDGTLKVERFSAALSCNGPEMVYRSGPYRRNVYPYHRWRINPGDMVTDFLLRDLREAGLFRAVFSYRDRSAAWLVLQGSLREFFEKRDGDGGQSVLTVTLTLLDLRESDLTARVLFQKAYELSTPLAEQGPASMAKGMSASMEAFSEAAIGDIYRAARKAVSEKGP